MRKIRKLPLLIRKKMRREFCQYTVIIIIAKNKGDLKKFCRHERYGILML